MINPRERDIEEYSRGLPFPDLDRPARLSSRQCLWRLNTPAIVNMPTQTPDDIRRSVISSSRQVLGLPEIVALILSHLAEQHALLACVRVNSLWAEEATTLLWRHEPPISAFRSLEGSDRVGYYAQKVESLEFAGDDCQCHSLFVGAQFGRLASINIDHSDDNREELLFQYLQPRLRRFHFYGGRITNGFLMEIQARCPNIKTVLIDDACGGISARGLRRFLEATPSISDFESWSGIPVTAPVWAQLANHASLKSLELASPLTADHVEAIMSTVTRPFPSLVCLTCTTESAVFSRLCTSFAIFAPARAYR